MMMPGRKYEAGNGYRYGFNGQEKDKEINENITTALFWEYDSRIGRRWNLDPKPNVSFSLYSTFENNPILYNDVLGDSIPAKIFEANNQTITSQIPTVVQNMFNNEYGIKVGFNSNSKMLFYDGDVETKNKISSTARQKIINILTAKYSRKKSLRKFGEIIFGHSGLKTYTWSDIDHGMQGSNHIRLLGFLGFGTRHTLFVDTDAFNEDDLTLKQLDYSGLTDKNISTRTFNMARFFEHEFFGHSIQKRGDPTEFVASFKPGKVELLPNLFRYEMGLPLRMNYGLSSNKGTVILFGISSKEVKQICNNLQLIPGVPYVLYPIIKKQQ